MAKGSKSSKTSNGSTRDADPISSLVQPIKLRAPIQTPVADAVLQSDRRRHDPTKSVSPPFSTKKAAPRIIATATQMAGKAATTYRRSMLLVNSPWTYARRKVGYSTISERLSFNIPKRIEMCIRRGVRKEVLHAKRKAGKAGQRKPVRNFWSAISCKR